MNLLDDTHLLFSQLAAIPDAQAVKSLIENHDALQHNDAALAALDTSLRSRLAMQSRDLLRDQRIQSQRRRLRHLVTPLPTRHTAPAA